MLQRAYSTVQIKAVDDDARLIEGIASTPEPDRAGDVVIAEGARFSLPLPLLWQHRHDQPIGHVIQAEVTKTGIKIRAQIAKDVLPRIDEAWALIRAGLVRGLSIGFRPIGDPEPIKGTFGLKFPAWEWLELSAVTIPMNATANIQAVKSFDAEHLAALGPARSENPSGVSERPRVFTRKDTPVQKTISEQIAAFEAERAAKSARMNEIQSKAAGEGRNKDDQEKADFDTLRDEIKAIDAELVDLREVEALNKAAAVAVVAATPAQASQARVAAQPTITVQQNVPAGIGFARAAIAQMASYIVHEGRVAPSAVAKQYWPSDQRTQVYLVNKETIAAGTSTHATYAGPLVDPTNLPGEFIEYLRPMTILGKFGTGNVPSLRRVPFNSRIVGQTSGGNGYWVGEGAPKPLTGFDFSATTIPYTKVAVIAVITQELARFSSPSAEALVRDSLAAALVEKLDRDFVDPGVAAVAGVNPASITNGVTALSSAGTSADNIRTDFQNLVEAFVADNLNPTTAVLIMPNTLALAASLMVNDLGQPEFPGLTMNGGSLLGIPVITSQYAQDGSGGGGNLVIMANASDIFLADDGSVTVDVSREASLQMSNTPSAGAAQLVSLWQNNLIGLRAERQIYWAKRRASAVAYMDDVNWGAVGSPAVP